DDGDVFPGIRAVREHGADPAISATVAGVHGATGGNGVVAGRSGDHVHDASGGNPGVKGGHANPDYVRVHRVSVGAVCDGGVGFGVGLRARRARAHAAELRAGVFVHSD